MSENNSDTVEATETASGEERSKANVQSTHNLLVASQNRLDFTSSSVSRDDAADLLVS
jgi:hypothetical protein